jgi:uncharacterized protein YjbJ (UPF0337 family)
MSLKGEASGRMKQLKGKANDIAGSITGNTGRQMKGKAEKVIGKAQAKLNANDRKSAREARA